VDRGERKGKERKNGRGKRRGKGKGDMVDLPSYPTFWYKETPMSVNDIHMRRIGLATRNQSALSMMSIN